MIAGRDAVVAPFGRYVVDTHGTFRAELLHVLTGQDGRAVGIHQRNGRSLDVVCCVEFAIVDGRIVSGRVARWWVGGRSRSRVDRCAYDRRRHAAR